jgi:tetratricopeptide (TPR) repeat protein
MSENSPFPPNPYVIGAPLTGDVGFFGRGETFAAVENALQASQQNVIVLFGQRRIGKTSLLHQIARRVRERLPVVPVYFDLQGKSGQALDEVLYQLARVIARSLKAENPSRERAGSPTLFRESFLPSLAASLQGRRLLLLFDEFDVLGDDQQASEDVASYTLFPYLSELILHEPQLAFVFVIGRRIEELTTRYQAIFKQAVYQRVGLLKPSEARDLILQPTQGILDYGEDTLVTLLGLTAAHPYLTQLLGYEVYNQAKASQTRRITPELVLSRLDAAMESGHGALNWFWDGLPRAERFIMAALAHAADDQGIATQEAIRQILEQRRILLTGLELKDAPDRLVDWDILERLPNSPDNFKFKIDLLRLWIRKQHPLDSVRRDVDYISQRAVRLYENGREAQEQGFLEDARDDYRSALKVNPNHSGAQLGLAQVEYLLGNLDIAIEEYKIAYQLDETSARDGFIEALRIRGENTLKINEKHALSDFIDALKLNKNNNSISEKIAKIHIKDGNEHIGKNRINAAKEMYLQALEYNKSEIIEEAIIESLKAYIEDNKVDSPSEAIAASNAMFELFFESPRPRQKIMDMAVLLVDFFSGKT